MTYSDTIWMNPSNILNLRRQRLNSYNTFYKIENQDQ